jgi:hypothetical protein
LPRNGLAPTPPDASTYASPCDAENCNADDSPGAASATAEGRQDDEGAGAAGTPLDLLTPDLERLAAELRARLSAAERERLAGLLTGATTGSLAYDPSQASFREDFGMK